MCIQQGTVIGGLNISAVSTTLVLRSIHLEFDEGEVNATRTKKKVDRVFKSSVRNHTTDYDISKRKSPPIRKVIYLPTMIRGNLRKS